MSNILTNNGRGISLTETKTYKLWESVGKPLVEANLTPEQINQLFANIEQGLTAVGGNRTLIGKGKDAASAINTEGAMWDKFKSNIGRGIKTMGHNLTTKVTADKLSTAWKKAGSPTDGLSVAVFLINNGVPRDLVLDTFASMRLPAPLARPRKKKSK